MENLAKIPQAKPGELLITPFGGCGEFGMNMTCYIVNKRYYVVDCGIMFPDPSKTGVEAILPNIDPYFSEADEIGAYLITHGHEDHVGGLPFIYERWPAPIYTTAWTAEIIKTKFTDLGLKVPPVTIVHGGDVVKLPDISVEWFHVNHSIPNCCALVIRSAKASVFHTGDFKFEKNPVHEPPLNIGKLEAIGHKGIDVLLADSTNSQSPGMCPGELSTLPHLKEIIQQSKGNIFISTFSSNLWRIKIILDIAQQLGLDVGIHGRGISRSIEYAKNLGILPNNKLLSDDKRATSQSGKKTINIVSGCQGEPLAVLNRMARREHKQLHAQAGDTIILSSRIIPGNERAVFQMMSLFDKSGVRVITTRDNPGIHVSGHAHSGDLELLLNSLKPKYYMPMHGTFTQLRTNCGLSHTAGVEKSHTRMIADGDVLSFYQGNLTQLGSIDLDWQYIDSGSKLLMAPKMLKQRTKIGELGSVFVSGVFQFKQRQWQIQPYIQLIGINLPEHIQADQWHRAATKALSDAIKDSLDRNVTSEDEVSQAASLGLRRLLAEILSKKVVVLAKIHMV